MALLQNITIYAQYPIRQSGGATGNERSQSGQRQDTHFNKYVGDAGLTGAVPNGAWPPYAWGMSIDEITPATVTINAGAIPLEIVIYPASVLIEAIFVPVVSTATKLSIIRITGSRPRGSSLGSKPKIRFTGTGGD